MVNQCHGLWRTASGKMASALWEPIPDRAIVASFQPGCQRTVCFVAIQMSSGLAPHAKIKRCALRALILLACATAVLAQTSTDPDTHAQIEPITFCVMVETEACRAPSQVQRLRY